MPLLTKGTKFSQATSINTKRKGTSQKKTAPSVQDLIQNLP